MPTQKFIFQGITSETHKSGVAWLLATADIQKILMSVAFISEEGVAQIENDLRSHATSTEFFAGIRNEITSRQALARLIGLGATLFTVDTGSKGTLFHPKLYFAKGQNFARLIVGSANLTAGGLNDNIEASIALELDLAQANDSALSDDVERLLGDMVSNHPSNVKRISAATELDVLLNNGLLIDESLAAPPRAATKGSSPSSDIVPRIQLSTTRLNRIVARARTTPRQVPQAARAGRSTQASPQASPAPLLTGIELVWQSKPLEESDLNIPSGNNTHPKGSMSLDQGTLDPSVDFRHYFRNTVFPQLTWTVSTRTPDGEEASAKCELIVKGISYGVHELTISHHTSTTSTTYRQRGPTTRLRWGAMKSLVATPVLLGRTLSLYKNTASSDRFVIDID